MVRGRIEPYSEQGFDGFVVVASTSSAEVLANDPRVASVAILADESTAPLPAPSKRSFDVATEQHPSRVVADANELLIGPYAYDGSGSITEIGTGQDQFRYDAFSRLKTSTVSGVAQEFTYDVYGNLESVKTNGTTSTIGVDAATNQLKSTGTYNVFGQYDAAGRMTSYLGRDSFSYDALDVMKESVVQNQRKVYLYTASDERIASVTISGGAETSSSWTVRDATGKVLRVYDKSMTGGERWWWKEDYVYREDQRLAAEVDRSAKTLHFFPDHLGASRLITGNGGTAIARHAYQPFGEEITAPNQDSERMKFTGHERDYSGGVFSDPIDYMHARYYSPSAGRFLTADPVRDSVILKIPQSWNRFSYVLNNPINLTDPTGLYPCRYKLTGEDAKLAGVEDGTVVDGECVEATADRTIDEKFWDFVDEHEAFIQMLSDATNGFANTLTFDATQKLHEAMGTDQFVNPCSAAYIGGEIGGAVWWTAFGGAVGGRIGGGDLAARELGQITVTDYTARGMGAMSNAQKLEALGGARGAVVQAIKNVFSGQWWKAVAGTTMSTGPTPAATGGLVGLGVGGTQTGTSVAKNCT